MVKTIFEQMGGIYEQQSDYLIPCLTFSTEEEKIDRNLGTAARNTFET